MIGAIVTVKYEPLKAATVGARLLRRHQRQVGQVELVVLGGSPQRPDTYWTACRSAGIERSSRDGRAERLNSTRGRLAVVG